MKTCSKCKIEKEYEDFRKDSSRKDGLCPQCKDCKKETDSKYYKENRDKKIQQSKEYKIEKGTYGVYNRDCYLKQKEKGKKRARDLNRRQSLSNYRKITADDINYLLKEAEYKCKYCGIDCREKYHVDHILPICKGGNNDIGNLAISCPSCNYSKGGKLLDEWDKYRPEIIITSSDV